MNEMTRPQPTTTAGALEKISMEMTDLAQVLPPAWGREITAWIVRAKDDLAVRAGEQGLAGREIYWPAP